MAEKQKQIIDYTPATTLATGDKLLLQKADGSTMNVDYAELARNIITQYNAQTLAGSAQSVQSALSALNSNFGHYWNLNYGTAIPNGADMDDYTTPGVYLTATQAIAQSLSHYPTNRSSKIIVEYQNSTSRIMQTVITTYTPWEIHRRIAEYTNGAYVWRNWYQEPMRDEITALNNSLMIVPNEAIELPANTTSFDAFDSVITSLGAFQGKIFGAQVGTNVTLDGVLISGGRKFCQIIRHSGTAYAAIYMFGWGGQDDRYFLVKSNGTWSCSKLPSRSEITALNNSITTFGKAVELLPTVDANNDNFRTDGFHVYKAIYSDNRTNFPASFKAGLFIDVGSTDFHWQFCCSYSDTSVLWFRNYYQNWKEWKQLTNA